MKVKIIFVVFLLSAVFIATAQNYQEYQLKDYFTPDITRKSMEFNFYGKYVHQKDDVVNSGFDLSVMFNSIKNTRKELSELYIYDNMSGGYNQNPNAITNVRESLKKNKAFTNHLTIQYDAKRYLQPAFFLRYGGYFQTSFYPSTETKNVYKEEENIYQEETFKNNGKFLNSGIQIGAGIGRIEDVTDARQAVYILDALSKKGRLKKQLTNNEVFQFAQLISTVKNKRFLDARLHRIDEIMQVDSFLVTGYYLSQSDAAYFTTLYDLWLYGDLFKRKSGREFSVYATPQIQKRISNVETVGISSAESKQTYRKFIALGEYVYEKPANLYWQHSGVAYIRYAHEQNLHDNDIYGQTSLSAKYTLGYYPNTRTHFNVGIEETAVFNNVRIDYDFGDEVVNVKTKNHEFLTNFSLNAYYYVSPNLLLSGTASAYHSTRKYNNGERNPSIPEYYPWVETSTAKKWKTMIEFKLTYKMF